MKRHFMQQVVVKYVTRERLTIIQLSMFINYPMVNFYVLDNHDLHEGDDVQAIIDQNYRFRVSQNHSATHLLHQALKDTLGKHVNQQGSPC